MRDGSKLGFSFLIWIVLALLPVNIGFAQGNIAKQVRDAKPAALLSKSWIPDDVDRAIPAVAPGAACSLSDVLARAGKKVEELAENVDRFTATEVLVHQSVDRNGRLRRPTTMKFDYLVSISSGRDGYFRVEELRNRNRSRSLDLFPGRIATNGTPGMVLIFNPRYIDDFKTKCEGLGEWHGQPAWQVRFEQRKDRPARICSFVVNGNSYAVNLRGRAWILADSFQVARIETDLMESIPKIRLNRSHESIEYRSVSYPNGGPELWLPSSAELYVDFKGQRFYRKHSFTDFKLFSVDMMYQVGDPGATQTAQQPTP